MDEEMALAAEQHHVRGLVGQLGKIGIRQNVVHLHLTDVVVMSAHLATASKLLVSALFLFPNILAFPFPSICVLNG